MAVALDPSRPDKDQPHFDAASLHRRADQDLLPAFALALNDVGLARLAIEYALVRTYHRASSREVTAQEVWAEAFQWVTTSRWPRRIPEPIGPDAFPSTTDAFANAVAQLPVRQRSALVCGSVLGWDDEQIAAAHRAPASTIDLRRRRGLGQLDKALEPGNSIEFIETLPTRFNDLCPPTEPLPGLDAIRRESRRTTWRTRSLVALTAIGCIAIAGLTIQAAPETATTETALPGQVDPPRESRAPHAPIGDGRGGFVAYARGGGELSVSADGELWTKRARLNVDRIDLRLFAERFFRSDDKYVMLIDSTTGGGASRSASDSPRIAMSEDLLDWTLLRLDLDAVPAGVGLRPEIDLLSAAVVDDTVLVSLRVDQEIDHRSLGLRPDDVCTTTDDSDGLLLHLCDGTIVPVAEQGPAVSGTDRLFVSRRGQAFEELATPGFFNPWGIVAYDGQFGMLEESSNQFYVSDDGATWSPFFQLGTDNRLGLIEANGDALMAISPSRTGWTSNLIIDNTTVTGALPLGIDPTTIWIKPQVASGPAGWAVYLTTSRPWDRSDDTVSGWAVHIDDWIIEQRPERASIRLRSTSTELVYEYHGLITRQGLALDHPSVRRSQFGGVRLFHPETGELMVDVSGPRIRDAWVSGADTEPDLSGERIDPGEGRLVSDGWTISGNIRTGPITLTDEGGNSQLFDDGYAFTNGDVSDGVESTVASDQDNGTLSFYDSAGATLVEVAAAQVIDALDPVPEEDQERPRAMVLFSPDGITWEQVWSTTRPTWYGSVAVGDDEILLSTAAFATGPERIPIDQADS